MRKDPGPAAPAIAVRGEGDQVALGVLDIRTVVEARRRLADWLRGPQGTRTRCPGSSRGSIHRGVAPVRIAR